MGELEAEALRTHLAANRRVAQSPQNETLGAMYSCTARCSKRTQGRSQRAEHTDPSGCRQSSPTKSYGNLWPLDRENAVAAELPGDVGKVANRGAMPGLDRCGQRFWQARIASRR
jgi:hypothetical protein